MSMTKIIGFCVSGRALVLLVLLALLAVGAPSQGQAFEYGAAKDTATVIRVVDGDTIVVSVPGKYSDKETSIRLLGVDPFEVYDSKQMKNDVRQYGLSKNVLKDLGHFGSDFVKQRVKKGMTVRISYSGERIGFYGRTRAFVHLPDGTVLNEELIKAGAALVYRSQSKPPYLQRYLELEAAARKARVGVWANPQIRAHYQERSR